LKYTVYKLGHKNMRRVPLCSFFHKRNALAYWSWQEGHPYP